jgi:hypothetical protein
LWAFNFIRFMPVLSAVRPEVTAGGEPLRSAAILSAIPVKGSSGFPPFRVKKRKEKMDRQRVDKTRKGKGEHGGWESAMAKPGFSSARHESHGLSSTNFAV